MSALSLETLLTLLFVGAFAPQDIEPLPPEEIAVGMPDTCEVAAFLDLRGVGTALDDFLEDLSRQSWIAGSPDIADELAEMVAMYEMTQTEATTLFGFDPLNDLTSASFCLAVGTNPSGYPFPFFQATIRGNFDTTAASALASFVGLAEHTLSDGRVAYGEHEEGVFVGLFSPTPGYLVLGTEQYLSEFPAVPEPMTFDADVSWGARGSRVLDLSGGNVRGFAIWEPSSLVMALVAGELGDSFGPFLRNLEGMATVWNTETQFIEVTAVPDGFDDYQMVIEGYAQYAEALPHMVRAFAYVSLGVLSPDDDELDDFTRLLVSNRDAVLGYLEDYGMLEDLLVEVAADPATSTMTLSVANVRGLQMTGLAAVALIVMMQFRSDSYYEDEYYYYEEPIYYE